MVSFLLWNATFILSFSTLASEAVGNTIYIKSDGSIDPPTAPIQQVGDVYVLTSNINESIVIERDDIIVDGSGYVLQSESAIGLKLSQRNNVTVKNFRVMGFLIGIKLENSNNSIIANNIIANNGYYGIWLQNSNNNTVLGCTTTRNNYGIYIQDSSKNVLSNNFAMDSARCAIYLGNSFDNTISRNTAQYCVDGFAANYSSNNRFTDNTATDNSESGIELYYSDGTILSYNTARNNSLSGIYLYSSGNCAISGNVMSGNRYNFGVEGTFGFHFENNVESLTNIADGKPIYYLNNVENMILDSSTNAATVYIINSRNVTIKDLNLTNNVHGIFLWNTNNSRIENIIAANNCYGIDLHNCLAEQEPYYYLFEDPECFGIFKNNVSDNLHGIHLDNCNNLVVAENMVANSTFDGIRLYISNNCTIADNTAINNENGFVLDSSNFNWLGSYLTNSIASNNTNCGIYAYNSTKNYIWGNTVTDNGEWGILLKLSDNNELYWNNASKNAEYGIEINSCKNTTVVSNTVSNNMGYGGMKLIDSPNSMVLDNIAISNTRGIYILDCKGSGISGNNMLGNKYNFFVYGSFAESFDIMVDETNVADGKPICYIKNSSNLTFDSSSNAATIYLIDSTDITVRDLTFTNITYGIFLWNTNNSRIENVTCIGSKVGMSLKYSNTITILDCTIVDCIDEYGIELVYCKNLTVSGSNIENNNFGIFMTGSSNIRFFHNNIINNKIPVYSSYFDINTWDNGAEGNYWSNYVGQDQDGNGIGDTPYIINERNQDRYPLIEPWSQTKLFPVNWSEKAYKISIVSNSTVSNLEFNQTGRNISFKITGPNGTIGFCNITIPKELLDAQVDQWFILVNGETVTPHVIENATHTSFYFTFTHSTKTLVIKGTDPIDDTAPEANAGPDQVVNEDTIVTFDGSSSTDNIEIANYIWTFTDGTEQTLTGVKPTYTFTTPGNYTITLNVTDLRGNWDVDSLTVTVLDITPPTPNAGTNQTVEEGTLVTFDASGSTDNVAPTNYTWTFTDGTIKIFRQKTFAYTFQTPGTYTVTLNVTDAAGNWTTDTIVVTVLAVPVWSKWWFWPIIGLTIIASVSFLSGIKYYQNSKKQKEILLEYESELEALPINHLDRARARFIKDSIRRKEKIDKFAEKYGMKLRPASTLEDVAKKLGIETER